MSASRRLRVQLAFGAGVAPLDLGECLWVASRKLAAFEWSPSGLESGFDLSPLHLPRIPGVHMAAPTPFGGLHGMLADSIPDGFGLRLMDKSLATAGYGWHTMTVSEVGVDISRADLLSFADKLGLPAATAADGIEQARSASSRFEALAVSLGARKGGAREWAKVFASIDKRLAPVTVAGRSAAPRTS